MRGLFLSCIFSLAFLIGDLYAEVSFYTVVEGDTLWELSEKTYNNPFLWRSLWEVNKSEVTNPDLIYAGQTIKLPSFDELKNVTPSVAQGENKATAEKIYLNAPKKDDLQPDEFSDLEELVYELHYEEFKQIQPQAGHEIVSEKTPEELLIQAQELSLAQGTVEVIEQAESRPLEKFPRAKVKGEVFQPDGVIIGWEEEKLLVSQGDIVYINLLNQEISKGERLGIYRKGAKLLAKNVVGKSGVGLFKVGVVRIEGTPSDKPVPAVIVYSSHPIKLEDMVFKAVKQ